MAKNVLQRLIFSFLFLLVSVAHAGQVVPVVYEDQYVSVRAAINEAGMQPVHIGDLLTLELRVRFDSHVVRVEQFDSEYFQRGFSEQPGIRLFSTPIVTYQELGDGLVETRALWSFQILGCPAELEICGGAKDYDLPVISTSYQLIDEFGQVLNEKSFRLTPWPGEIALVPALSYSTESERSFSDYFPAGAYPKMLSIRSSMQGGGLVVLAGTLLFAVGLVNKFAATGPLLHLPKETRAVDSRWEHLLLDLNDSTLRDDEWTDAYRRCATWFFLDELDVNPYEWLTGNMESVKKSSHSAAVMSAFFTDITKLNRIETGSRIKYLTRFRRIADDVIDMRGSGPQS